MRSNKLTTSTTITVGIQERQGEGGEGGVQRRGGTESERDRQTDTKRQGYLTVVLNDENKRKFTVLSLMFRSDYQKLVEGIAF